jgi:hypothetical protein
LKNSQETTDEQKIVEKTDKATEAMPENETEEVIDHLIEQTECQDDNGACVLLLDSAKTYDNIVQDEQEIALNMDTTTTDLKSPDTNVASNSAFSNLHIDINNTSDINMQENEVTDVALSIKSKKDERYSLSIKKKGVVFVFFFFFFFSFLGFLLRILLISGERVFLLPMSLSSKIRE